ncbi:hypothetical protein [Umezawaea sp. Da 62-37]|uniref:hypothetical protein n=1 Tax=Umezawaea sp. Da 62-37 TaxID=3075927 RepID=UPI0028F730C1|nr:hypothetical protein [Umezawaea sp. Da 62-37]WNV87641.1 hypothetical protein RM788_04895 [Umezawaea sp. Da 62-37]
MTNGPGTRPRNCWAGNASLAAHEHQPLAAPPLLGDVGLPPLPGGADQALWPALLTLAERLPVDHAVIGGIMVYLHGTVAGRAPARVTSDVDVLCDVEVMPSSLRDTVAVLTELGYRIDPASPLESSHRYLGPGGEQVDVLAPAKVRPPPDLITTPPGRTIEVPGGKPALRHRVVIRASYEGRTGHLVVPDLARALMLKAAAYAEQHRKSPAKAFHSKHLQDITFLVSLIDDLDQVLADLGTAPPDGHLALAAVLDDTGHHAWTAAGDASEDARLVWDALRHSDTVLPKQLGKRPHQRA